MNEMAELTDLRIDEFIERLIDRGAAIPPIQFVDS